MTQKWLAGAAKVSERTVIRAEQGRDVSSENLLSICAVLGLESDALGADVPAEVVEPRRSGWLPLRAGFVNSLLRSAAQAPVGLHVLGAAILVSACVVPPLAAAGREAYANSVKVGVLLETHLPAMFARDFSLMGASLIAGKPVDVSILPHLPSYRCDTTGPIRALAFMGCEVDHAEIRTVRNDGAAVEMVVSKLSDRSWRVILATLPEDDALSFEVAPAGEDLVLPQEGWTSAQDLLSKSDRLPSGGSSLALRMSRKGDPR
jgi:DNA-binding XRE family transcriptional regulator